MDIKLLELRDRATMIPVMAVYLLSRSPDEQFLLRRAGYAEDPTSGSDDVDPYILLVKLDGCEAHYDPFDWDNMRTMTQAHLHIIGHWHELRSGDVVDVEFITGETTAPKQSERVTEGLL